MNATPALSGRHAVITGGGRGIGAAIARALAEQGARVTLMGRTLAPLEEQAGALREITEVHCERADVARPDSVDAAFAGAVARLGRVDILVNNAGQALSAPFVKTEFSLWQQMLAVNLTGVLPRHRARSFPECWRRDGGASSTSPAPRAEGLPYVSRLLRGQARGDRPDPRAGAGDGEEERDGERRLPGYTDTDIVRDSIANIQAKTGRSEAEALAELDPHSTPRAA
jgi:NAD(P)-dependent dehydrogenase (short-subunit alcohol dehydrogenase family)